MSTLTLDVSFTSHQSIVDHYESILQAAIDRREVSDKEVKDTLDFLVIKLAVETLDIPSTYCAIKLVDLEDNRVSVDENNCPSYALLVELDDGIHQVVTVRERLFQLLSLYQIGLRSYLLRKYPDRPPTDRLLLTSRGKPHSPMSWNRAMTRAYRTNTQPAPVMVTMAILCRVENAEVTSSTNSNSSSENELS